MFLIFFIFSLIWPSFSFISFTLFLIVSSFFLNFSIKAPLLISGFITGGLSADSCAARSDIVPATTVPFPCVFLSFSVESTLLKSSNGSPSFFTAGSIVNFLLSSGCEKRFLLGLGLDEDAIFDINEKLISYLFFKYSITKGSFLNNSIPLPKHPVPEFAILQNVIATSSDWHLVFHLLSTPKCRSRLPI